jgi:hypothetical protein
MAGINYGRVLLGGLVAGVVANACDFVTNMYLLADDTQQMAQRLGLDRLHVNGGTVAATWVAIDFLLGLLIVWLYAAIRPRFGPGPTTAVVAGLVPFAAATLVLYGFTEMGVFTLPTFIKGTLFSAVTFMLAALAGARIYREE